MHIIFYHHPSKPGKKTLNNTFAKSDILLSGKYGDPDCKGLWARVPLPGATTVSDEKEV
jgi:hypothetical protein